jgi:hypothetical protein
MHIPRFAMTRNRAVLLAALVVGLIAAAWPLHSWWRQEREFRTAIDRAVRAIQFQYPQLPEHEFRISLEHYARAMQLLHPRSGREPSMNDMKTAIHHLRGISAESPFHKIAADMLANLELRVNRAQDFPAIEQEQFLSCMATASAKEAELQAQVAQEHPCRHLLTSDGRCVTSFCGTGLAESCAPLATRERLAQLNALARSRL